VWFDGDLSFDNEYRYFYDRGVAQGTRPRENGQGYYGDGFPRTFLEATTATGLRINYAPVGSALLWAPFYVGADAGVRVAQRLGGETPADGLSQPYIAATTYASAFYGFLSLVLSMVAVRRILGRVDWSVAAVWLGTPLVFYMYVAPGFSHATSAFVVAAFLVTWLHVRETWSWRGIVALGALAAIMGMVREQDVFMAIGPVVDFVVHAAGSVRRGSGEARAWLLRGAAGIAAFVVCFLPQVAAYLILNGRLGPDPSVDRKMDWTSPYAWHVLASPDYGLIFWTPLALPAIAGLVWLSLGRVPRQQGMKAGPPTAGRWIGAICLLMCASQIYISGSVDSWMGGTFGQRRLVSLTPLFAIGLASLFRAAGTARLRTALGVVVVLCTWWNLGLVAQFGSNVMNRERLEIGRNAYHNFVTIPRMLPGLAYRYVFDRESFYQRRPAG
jgi:hypothetical protein